MGSAPSATPDAHGEQAPAARIAVIPSLKFVGVPAARSGIAFDLGVDVAA